MKIIFALACVLFGVNQMAEALQIQCTFFIDEETQEYQCEATVIITGDIKDIDRIHGLHLPGRGNTDTKGFAIRGQKGFKKFPRGLGRFFRKLKKVVVEDTEVEEIGADDLEGLEEVEEVDIGDNAITDIPDDLFKFLPFLRFLRMGGNPIININITFFDFLLNLESMDFSSKKCSSGSGESGENKAARQVMKMLLKNQSCNSS